MIQAVIWRGNLTYMILTDFQMAAFGGAPAILDLFARLGIKVDGDEKNNYGA